MEIFRLFGSIFVDSGEAEKSISKTSNKAGDLAKGLGKAVLKAGAVGAAVVGAATVATKALFNMASDAAGVADHIDKMSQKIGVSKEAYQELDYICNLTGANVDGLKAGMKKLANQMDAASKGTAKSVDTFNRLGITVTKADGSLRDQEEVMWEAFEALQGVENETEKATLATQLFGGAGQDLIPMLNGSTGSIEAMKEECHKLGLVISDEDIQAGADFNDAVYKLNTSFGMIKTKIGLHAIPALQSLSEKVLEHMPEINATIDDILTGLGETVGDFITAANDSDTTFGKIWNNMQESAIHKGHSIRAAMKLISKLARGDLIGAFQEVRTAVSEFYEGAKADLENLGTLVDQFVTGYAESMEKLNTVGGVTSLPVPGVGLIQYDQDGNLISSGGWSSQQVSTMGSVMRGEHAKALNTAYEFRGETWFGTDETGRRLYAGESGSETLIGTNALMRSISEASGGRELAEVFSGYMEQMIGILQEYLPDMSNKQVVLNTGALVGQLAPAMDSALGGIANRRRYNSV